MRLGSFLSIFEDERKPEGIFWTEANRAGNRTVGREAVKVVSWSCLRPSELQLSKGPYPDEVPSASPRRRTVALPPEKVQSDEAVTARANVEARNSDRRVMVGAVFRGC